MIKAILNNLKREWFLWLSLGLITFIVLYPKIPLFDLIPGYIVRVRLEDFFVALCMGIYGLQLLRGKAKLKSPVTGILVFYAVVGVLSILDAMFVIKTVPLNLLHVGKMILHFARRLEYFSVFFLFYSAVKTKQNVKWLYGVITLILLAVSVYGFGQKYLYWPVYSTMNREFSKGMRLVLTDHARVPSTFGGHYDMSAFVMLALTLILGAFFLIKDRWMKLIMGIAYIAGFWLLILGSSRSSFIAYILSTGVLITLLMIHKKSLWWGISRGFTVLGLSMLVMLSFGDLSSRFSQLGIVQQINQKFEALLKPAVAKPDKAIAVNPIDESDAQPVPKATAVAVATSSGTVPIATISANTALPPDVYVNVPDLKAVTATIGGKTVTQIIEVPREFSPCTYQYGLSACIRFDTLWPRALWGFRRNPLLGSGFSTLTKSTWDEFTEAESTDNDFLRNLGESGILGVIGFYGPIAIFMVLALRKLEDTDNPYILALLFGLIAGSLGLFLNAAYIDVFEASKVAFVYWSLMGAAFASLELLHAPAKRKK